MTPHSPTFDDLTEALGMAQRFGALGPGSIDVAVSHARAFVAALDGVTGRVLDLGSGGGLPGLVIAVDRPDLDLVLVDRRQKRTDLCRRMLARLGLADRVAVIEADAADLTTLAPFIPADAVVSRGFGPPAETARHALPLLAPGGLLIVSEPPTATRWDDELLSRFDLRVTARVDQPARVVVLSRPA